MSEHRQPETSCNACKDGLQAPFPFTMAFQPIVDVKTGKPFAYEALVRGPNGESAGSILAAVNESNRYSFDQQCRVKAITLAAQLGLAEQGAMLSINFLPGAVYNPSACIQLTLKTARSVGFPLERLIFEITEGEEVVDRSHLRGIVEEYRRRGFKVALDDFGAGYCGMNLLADLPCEIVKLDMELTRDLHLRPAAKMIVRSMAKLSVEMGTLLIAEGIENILEYEAVRACGIHLMQGYFFAKPALEALPVCRLPLQEPQPSITAVVVPAVLPILPHQLPQQRSRSKSH